VGNSRWHWAEFTGSGLTIRHREADAAVLEPWEAATVAWAAVGRLPAGLSVEPPGRVLTTDVPLQRLPAWLGVDRALAAWRAWRQCRQTVLVADAGTVLSLTRVTGDGCFAGGRLMAGLGLQLRAMASGTAGLPDPPSPAELAELLADQDWPDGTCAAMAVGVTQALAAALVQALRQTQAELPLCRLVLTGGDAPLLLRLLREQLGPGPDALVWEPDLALRGLVALRPVPGRDAQSSPRSART